jgi:hypothetical protein
MRKLVLFVALLLPALWAHASDPLPSQDLQGDISTDRTLTADRIWRMKGFVYVRNNATLTIEPGTVIMGDSDSQGTLVVTRGSKIMAEGTPLRPIVFTSDKSPGQRNPGDWGGVVLLGRAPINTESGTFNVEGIPPSEATLAGGNDPNDNSGVMRYVRIEFAGEELTPNNELNGLTMAGVGSATVIEYIQVSYNDDDAFEWFGGTVDGRYLIALGNIDDDFDGDLGWRGRVQFGLIVRDPQSADAASGGHSNAFEQDNAPNEATGATALPRSAPVFSNVTVIGPIGQAASRHPNYQNGMRLRTGTSIGIFNSIVMGFPGLLRLDGPTSWNLAQQGQLNLENVIGTGNFIAGSGGVTVEAAEQWFRTAAFENEHVASPEQVGLVNPFFYAGAVGPENFDPRPAAGSHAEGKGRFTHARLQGDFFQPVTYAGAFAPNGERWDYPWANYDPQNTDYTRGVQVSASDDFALPTDITLNQNYPNPFNPTTTIEFHLERAGQARLAVFDLLGREVALLLDAAAPAGTSVVAFDASNLPSGVYVYRLQTDARTVSRSMMLMK